MMGNLVVVGAWATRRAGAWASGAVLDVVICKKCRREITKPELWKAKVEKDEVSGKIKWAMHNKCFHALRRRKELDDIGRNIAPTHYETTEARMNADDLTEEAKRRREVAEAELKRLRTLSLTHTPQELIETSDGKVSMDELMHHAEEQVALTRRQEELAEERARESRSEGWSDHRDPVEKEL